MCFYKVTYAIVFIKYLIYLSVNLSSVLVVVIVVVVAVVFVVVVVVVLFAVVTGRGIKIMKHEMCSKSSF